MAVRCGETPVTVLVWLGLAGGCFSLPPVVEGNPPGNGAQDVLAARFLEPLDYQRTVVLIQGITQPGQDLFVRGGIDHDYSKNVLHVDCVDPDTGSITYKCAVPIKHRNLRNPTTSPWKAGDHRLDWYGKEAGQDDLSHGMAALGTPGDWTTQNWVASWGVTRTVAADGYGVETLNTVGPDYWMMDVDMDCAKALPSPDGTRWFEIKSFISNGPGWEPDVQQADAPYPSKNHFGKCGMLNVFVRGSSAVTYAALPLP